MSELKNIYFYNHCQQILSRMTDEEILNLKNAPCNKSRIENLYRHSVQVDIPRDFQLKDRDAADTLKSLGNDYFKKGENFKAVECYNQGILICPQSDDVGKKLVALLIANRSAAFFDLKRYKKALFSIDYLLDVKFYPEELLYKIWIRKGKCHEEEKEVLLAIDAYKKVKQYVTVSKLSDKEKIKKNEEIEKILKQLQAKAVNLNKEKHPEAKNEVVETNDESVNKVKLQEAPTLGRYATAAVDIDVGSVVLSDNPFAHTVATNNFLKNCQYCMMSTNNFVACEGCNSAIFCSRECKSKAHHFHKYECPILQFLATAGVSLNCLLALRMVTKNPLEYFTKQNKEKVNFTLKDRYDTNDYNAILNLCNHNDKRVPGQFVHYSCMIIFLLRLLKQTNYFNGNVTDEFLTDNELQIGIRLLDHLLLLEFNAHEVSEVTVTATKDVQEFKTETIGGAIYPNLAFFNHSCEPSVIRYNDGTKMIVKAIKPIKKGETIYENYGPMYTTDRRTERQEFLESRYCFTCMCVPCIQDWPTLDVLNPNVFKIRCKNSSCRAIMLIKKDSSNIELKCTKCGTPNTFMNTLMKLMEMDKIAKKAEESYRTKEYEAAANSYYKALKVYYEHIIPPHPDIVHLHQRLRECLIHFGNHRDEPPFDKQFPKAFKY